MDPITVSVFSPFPKPSVHYIISKKTTSISKVSPHYPSLYILYPSPLNPCGIEGASRISSYESAQTDPQEGPVKAQGMALGVWGVGVEMRKKRAASHFSHTSLCSFIYPS